MNNEPIQFPNVPLTKPFTVTPEQLASVYDTTVAELYRVLQELMDINPPCDLFIMTEYYDKEAKTLAFEIEPIDNQSHS